MTRWRDLRDPEVEESNFIHPSTGEEYNYRAAETDQVQKDLQGGLLARFPLTSPAVSELPSADIEPQSHSPNFRVEPQYQTTAITSPCLLISYNWDSEAHSQQVLNLSNQLRSDAIDRNIDQYISNPSEGWPLWMNN